MEWVLFILIVWFVYFIKNLDVDGSSKSSNALEQKKMPESIEMSNQQLEVQDKNHNDDIKGPGKTDYDFEQYKKAHKMNEDFSHMKDLKSKMKSRSQITENAFWGGERCFNNEKVKVYWADGNKSYLSYPTEIIKSKEASHTTNTIKKKDNLIIDESAAKYKNISTNDYDRVVTIDELHDILYQFKADALGLYRYGSLGRSRELFKALHEDDKKRLLNLAHQSGNSQIYDVGDQLARTMKPRGRTLTDIVKEFEVNNGTSNDNIVDSWTAENLFEITKNELEKAVNKISNLTVEEAYWILIPMNRADEIRWIPAFDHGTEKIPISVSYDLSDEERYELLALMRESKCIIHIHNHPIIPGYDSILKPSGADRGFANNWKNMRKELGARMKFYVIQAGEYIEYS